MLAHHPTNESIRVNSPTHSGLTVLVYGVQLISERRCHQGIGQLIDVTLILPHTFKKKDKKPCDVNGAVYFPIGAFQTFSVVGSWRTLLLISLKIK